jgi:hypothetical protein
MSATATVREKCAVMVAATHFVAVVRKSVVITLRKSVLSQRRVLKKNAAPAGGRRPTRSSSSRS